MRLLQFGVFEKDKRMFYVTKLFWVHGEPSRAEFVEIDRGAFEKGVVRKKGEGFERSFDVIKELLEQGKATVVRGGGLTYKDGQ